MNSLEARGSPQISSGPQGYGNYFTSCDSYPSYSGRPSGGRMSSITSSFNPDAKNPSRSSSTEKKSAPGATTGRKSPEKGEKKVVKKDIPDEKLEKEAVATLQEFLHSHHDPQEVFLDVQDILKTYNDSNFHLYFKAFIYFALDSASRDQTILNAKLMCDLVVNNIVSDFKVYKALEVFLAFGDDIVNDYPIHYWDFISIFLGHCFLAFSDSSVNKFFLSTLPERWKQVRRKKLHAFMADVINNASSFSSKAAVYKKWKSSNMDWSVFLPSSTSEESFIRENGLEFTVRSPGSAESDNSASGSVDSTNLQNKLEKLEAFILNNEVKQFLEYINRNFTPEEANTPTFTGAFYKSLVRKCITRQEEQSDYKLDEKLLTDYLGKFQSKFTQGERVYEFKTLDMLTALIADLEHPKGMLGMVFEYFHEHKVISREGFTEWAESRTKKMHSPEVRGFAVAAAEVNRFLTWLHEDDEFDAEYSTDK